MALLRSASRFSGITLYLVGAIVLLLGTGVLMFNHQVNKIGKLNKEIATLERDVKDRDLLLADNRRELDKVVQLNEDCANKRSAAENRANQATSRLAEATLESIQRSKERTNDIRKDNQAAVCSTPVPDRTTWLLIEAASGANRGGDRN